MGIIRRLKNRKKPLLNYKGWMDYERINIGARAIRDSFSIYTVKRKPSQPQSLEQVMDKYHLSEETIEKRKQEFLRLLFIMLFVTVGVFAYSVYLLSTGGYLGFLVGTSLTLIAASLCFRYHFWYFQLKHRKLGCTWLEWLRIGILGAKK